MSKLRIYSLLLVFIGLFSFIGPQKPGPKIPKQPNIVWLVAEDMSPYIAAFGDHTIETPNLDWLAKEGICYDNFYTPSPVCSPSRAALATGMYPTQIGANHMRTGPWYKGSALTAGTKPATLTDGSIAYEATPAPEVKMFTEYLRKAGYYCTNNFKEDYQFIKTLGAWDVSGPEATWKDRKEGQPFFAMKTFMVTHESQIWAKTKDSLWVAENLDVPIPPYLPNTEVAKKDIRRMYSNIKQMDAEVGQFIQELKDSGELENTIIIWYTDHGGPLPRQKRAIYDSGLQVPMIIRFPDQAKKGTREDRMISFVDMPATVLSLAGIKPPSYMNGKAFLGKYEDSPRDYIYAASDRYDEATDAIRAVRDKRYLYVRNYLPELPMYLHVAYRDQMALMQELYRLRDEGKLTPTQALWFAASKQKEELYDTETDPYQIHNIIDDPKLQAIKAELSLALDNWIKSTGDLNLIPESELKAKFLPNGKQPVTSKPIVSVKNGKVKVTCPTEGASIAYKFINKGEEPTDNHWHLYTGPFAFEKGKELVVYAHRLGYLPASQTIQ